MKIKSFMEIMQLKPKDRPENLPRYVSPERAEILLEAVSKQIDPRIQEEVGFFAISKGNKVLGQVGVIFPKLTSTVGAIEFGHSGGAICLYVDFQHRRRGIGTQLKQRQMEYFRERGIEFSSSITTEIFEGIQDVHDRKLGYRSVLNYPNYFMVSRGGEDTPSDTEYFKEAGDSAALWQVYYALKEDCLGFIERPKNFVEIGRLNGLLANAPFYQDQFLVGKKGSQIVSFANTRQGTSDFKGYVFVNDTHAVSEDKLNIIINQIERESPGKVILFSPVVDPHLRRVLTKRKYQHYLTGAHLMMTSLTGTTNKKKLNDLFNFDDLFVYNVYEDI
ncbi:MAG: GNAT family N-acetyltransferase [Candidatus Bathyarchaeota archaeon]